MGSNPHRIPPRTLYDNRGRVVQQIDPDVYDPAKDGLPQKNTYSDPSAGHTYEYAENGNLVSETTKYGLETEYTYSKIGNLFQKHFDLYDYYYLENGKIDKICVDGETVVDYAYNVTDSGITLNDGDYVDQIAYSNGDTETGCYYLQSRYYNPEWGRFISPDNFSYIDNSTRLGFNAYIYCTNNPVMFIDHSGAKETYNITPQGLVVAIAINETFMIWDLLVIKDELNLNIDLNVSSLWDYAFFKQHVYKTAFDSGKYDNNYSNNMNINAKAGEFLSVFTDIFTEFFGGIASVIFSVFEFGADLLIDFSGRFFNGVGTAIMALYDTVSTTLNVLISNVISSFATPFAGIATGVGLSIVDELFTRDLVEVFAYSWHFIFNSLFSWWYDG